ncbi:MAG: MarR family transcriptional regulator [Alphaproteobacteria bacterium]|nr:MarR family transcriptional regulator [Alphaproteobacteria bacterium]
MRRFNRFYTAKIGVLQEGLLESAFSLAQARILYELAHREKPTAAALARELGLDPGYLSRILRGFTRQGFVVKETSPSDGRQSLLSLTAAGRAAFAPLDRRSRDEIGELLGTLSEAEQRCLVGAMARIETLLGTPGETKAPYLLRPHQPGDMGWIVHRQATLYAREYGWDETFEALLATIVAEFIQHFEAKRERCWIAEKDGEIIGSVFLARKSETAAKLRMLYVEPQARGLGIGARLVSECVRFARRSGYRKVTLWTNSILLAARHIYEKAGFRKIAEEPHHSFGHDLVSETWELKL